MTPLRVLILLMVLNFAIGLVFYRTYCYGYERGQSEGERAMLQAQIDFEQKRVIAIQKLKLHEKAVHEIQEQASYDLNISDKKILIWKKDMQESLNENTQYRDIAIPDAVLRVREDELSSVTESADRSAELSYGLFHSVSAADKRSSK